ncbi:CDP-alcohol phosphatidyltransferase family protein [Bacteroidales bacterium OttesenSCG-928-M06]|nr:CDP-alcohol phosphatidyltransferase family protein [Bacteroidales bacterium OttesenSCG-928-M06]
MEDKDKYESTLKSGDTEEYMDLIFYRKLGYWWALFFQKIGVSPNQISIASIFIGVAAGVCFYFTSFLINLIGVLLLIWANTYDSADGQLARMTNQQSEWGRILDGICSYFWFVAIYIAIICRLWPQWDYWILILAIVAGYSHSKQVALADYYRNVHLLFLKGKDDSELDNSDSLKEKLKEKKGKGKGILYWFESLYIIYTKGQERWTPQTQKLFNLINRKYKGKPPRWFRKDYCRKSLKYIKYTNYLSFNLRSIALFISVLINLPWLYFVFEATVMNGLLFYMVNRYERLGRKFRGGLELEED